MRQLLSGLIVAAAASVIHAFQTCAKLLGAPRALVTPKNPPPPGATKRQPRSVAGRAHGWIRSTLERLGDPGIVLVLALEEHVSNAIGLLKFERERWTGLPGRIATQAALFWRAMTSRQKLVLQQAKNTRYIFVLVRNNPDILRIPRSGEFDLIELVERAFAIGEFESIWTIEGLGHVYTQRAWSLHWGAASNARGILTDGAAAHLPERSLTMMHAGLGLGLAEPLLKRISPGDDIGAVKATLAEFLELCRNNSRPGYLGCALESLGLVTRCFEFPLMGLVPRALQQLDLRALEFFWRGAGRGAYFAPANLLQPLSSPWLAAERGAADPRVRECVRSGVVWPASIVNMRTPQVFEEFLRRIAHAPAHHAAIKCGIGASATMAADVEPQSQVLQRYLEYRPGDPGMRDLWQTLVHEPLSKAITLYRPVLARHRMLDEVFRFQDLDALIAQLEHGSVQSSASLIAHPH